MRRHGYAVGISTKCFQLGVLAGIITAGLTAAFGQTVGAGPEPAVDRAFYVVSTSDENHVPPIRHIHLRITGRETVDERPMVWWELTAVARDRGTWGVRILSERAPMTAHEGVGEIERYLYRDGEGHVCEYRDTATGRALLPSLQFRESFLPRVAPDAVFKKGFASAGAFIGHVLVRGEPVEPPVFVSFDNPRVLNLRSDLIIGTQACVRIEGEEDKTKKQEGNHKERPYTRAEYETMIAAGMNFFEIGGDLQWLMYEPVFFRTPPSFPDTFYRSNWVPGRMFIDEPSVRMGWSGGIPANATGPEQVAEAMRQRVASHYTLEHRKLPHGNGSETGTLDLYAPPAISWDTDYWSAWWQLAAGAPAVVHEGRYVHRGYGWEPEALFGPEGLDDLTFRDQVNCLNAFLRGAARAFDGDWGTSVYPEGEPGLRLPALIQAYDMGARYLWFWTYPPLTYAVERELCEGILRHAAAHPRGDLKKVNRAAKVGIAFPAGHAFSWEGTWGVQREQRSAGGASYGDISAAGMWEGILCSRRGETFDFLVNEPRIRSLGYERLVIVGNDGSLKAEPGWSPPRAPAGLRLEFDAGTTPDVAGRAAGLTPEYTVRRANGIEIDGDLSDWADADWIQLSSDAHGFPDGVTVETTLLNDISQERWRANFTTYMGMTFQQIDEDLEKKYVLEGLNGRGVAVTQLEAGSPADKAGIREGDVLIWVWNRRLDWQFQMYERLQHIKNKQDKLPLRVVLRRSGRYEFGGPGDLGADVALRVDDGRLYVAARVTDDTFFQPYHDRDFWKADSLQIGLDASLERRQANYGEQDNEFGLVLMNGQPKVWRYHGRRGQPLGEIQNAQVRIVRQENRTIYEAAIPLEELSPLSPDLWPMAGFNVVVNDSDGKLQRKGRLELKSKAMTQGKKPAQYAVLAFEPSPQNEKVSAAVLWQRQATPEKGHFRVVIAVRSPQSEAARVDVQLTSLDSPETSPVRESIDLPVRPAAREHNLVVRTDSPPGRYAMHVKVVDRQGAIVAQDRQPVYIYPR